MTKITKPAIELKRISHNERLSEETNAYAADLWVDGVKWGEVGNDGHGGCDYFHGIGGKNYAAIMELNTRIEATYPASVSEWDDPNKPGEKFVMKADLESVCGDLLSEWLIAKDLKRALSRRFLYTRKDKAGLYEVPFKQKGRTWTVDQIKAAYDRQGVPLVDVLNTMDFDAALAVYRAAGA